MQLKALPFEISVCQLKPGVKFEKFSGFYCLAQTHDEVSLVCQTVDVPKDTLKREDGWMAFYIEGTLDFSLVGIMAKISGLLAQAEISIFAISTFNTDYFLVKKEFYAKAKHVLHRAGYTIN